MFWGFSILDLNVISGLLESVNKCSNKRESRRNAKETFRRMKKYLFGQRQSARRSRRSALDWIINLNNPNSAVADSRDHSKIDDQNIPLHDAEARSINVVKDISPIHKSKGVPTEFYNIVSASNMELSKFSKQHSGASVSDPQSTPVNRKADRRNYKRRKSLFKQQSSKYSKSSQKCPVFLYSDSHGLTCMCKAWLFKQTILLIK